MDAVTLSQVLELLKRTGKNTDAAGTTTLFARLAQIAEYTDQLEAFVDTLETKLGLNTDTAGTSTVFARLAQIAAYVDTLEGSLGQTGDAASGTGSLHAKIADIKNYLTGTLNPNVLTHTPKMTTIGYVNTVSSISTGSSDTILVNYSGAGILTALSVIPTNSYTCTGTIEVVADGAVVFSAPIKQTESSNPNYYVNYPTSVQLGANIYFKTSLIVRGRASCSSCSGGCLSIHWSASISK
ncbi:hypothetical protein ACKE5C_11040 [Aneurinibacillus thermoaerophilus]|jgi:hypothetical protein|uniref:Uncharacterized protein n=1 Tax=Aneurinibacillus thermoaerophilus TaxID=143495 RepID=A0ABX8Y7F6_ANETH|nr:MULTISPECIES: hypothetical protein [Aneurinibacillus]QYY41451.1 hypothetical protein K3F53_10905 [Aneurinibacillus thermoaerophilus]